MTNYLSKFVELLPFDIATNSFFNQSSTVLKTRFILPPQQTTKKTRMGEASKSSFSSTTENRNSFISRMNRQSKRWHMNNSNNSVSKEIRYRIVILGAAGVGKSTIISQYLYGCGPDAMLGLSLATVLPVSNTVRASAIMDMHEVAYEVEGRRLILELLEARIEATQDDNWWVDIPCGDAYVIVYSVTDDASLEAIGRVREELVKQHSYLHVPIVVVANKTDADDGSKHEQHVITELTTVLDWEHGYAATSAASDPNSLSSIFLQIFRQVKFPPDHEMKAWLDLHNDLSQQKDRDTPFHRLSRRIKKLMCGPQ